MKIIAFLSEADLMHKIVRHIEDGEGEAPRSARHPLDPAEFLRTDPQPALEVGGGQGLPTLVQRFAGQPSAP